MKIITRYLVFFHKASKEKEAKPEEIEKAYRELSKVYEKIKKKMGKNVADAGLIYLIVKNEEDEESESLDEAMDNIFERINKEHPGKIMKSELKDEEMEVI